MLLLLNIFPPSLALNKISGCGTRCSTRSVLKPYVTLCNVISVFKSAMCGENKLSAAVALQFSEFQFI